jgi:hypothetical protein
VAGILLQTLFFKFTGADESRYIFSTVGQFLGIGGVEPWGRIGSGVIELVASLLLLIPATAVAGAVLALGVMGGAIASHVVILGIAVQGDGGLLFGLALVAFAGQRLGPDSATRAIAGARPPPSGRVIAMTAVAHTSSIAAATSVGRRVQARPADS